MIMMCARYLGDQGLINLARELPPAVGFPRGVR